MRTGYQVEIGEAPTIGDGGNYRNDFESVIGGALTDGDTFFPEGILGRKDGGSDVGVCYFNARWYDPKTGRFASEDPIRDGLNWYAYVGNNPLKWTDPTGMLRVGKSERRSNRAERRERRQSSRRSNQAKRQRKRQKKANDLRKEGKDARADRIDGRVDNRAARQMGRRNENQAKNARNGSRSAQDSIDRANRIANQDFDLQPYANYGPRGYFSDQSYALAGRHVTSGFGYRDDPISGDPGQFHPGVDTRVIPNNTPVLISGTVNFAGWGGDMTGNLVQVKANIGGQTFYSNAMHMSDVNVKNGDTVSSGDIVGTPGSTGSSTNPHNHHDIFTYDKDTALVRGMLDSGVDSFSFKDKYGTRTTFNPEQAINYFISNEIRF